MLANLQKLKEERESGFTLIELLVVILIIGILSAIAIPAFLNQRKSAVDSSVQSDVKNVATEIETWATAHHNEIVPDQTITQSGIGGDFAFISAAAMLAGAGDNAKVSAGTTVLVKGTSKVGEFCLYGLNAGGDLSGKEAGITYDSASGGLNTFGGACATSGAKAAVPAEAPSILAGAKAPADTELKADGTKTAAYKYDTSVNPGKYGYKIVMTAQLYEAPDGSTNVAYTGTVTAIQDAGVANGKLTLGYYDKQIPVVDGKISFVSNNVNDYLAGIQEFETSDGDYMIPNVVNSPSRI